jgi:hypothetical protein
LAAVILSAERMASLSGLRVARELHQVISNRKRPAMIVQ